MNPEKLVCAIIKSVLEENVSTYEALFSDTDVKSVSDEYWSGALKLYGALSEEEKIVLLRIVRQVVVDTISNVLGVLDGTSYAEGLKEDLVLTYGNDEDAMNGELQSLFLALLEEKSSAVQMQSD